jgi:hypothetical protein
VCVLLHQLPAVGPNRERVAAEDAAKAMPAEAQGRRRGAEDRCNLECAAS